MKDMTDELLKLYAQRQSAQGHVYPADTEWMKEFEDAFEYNETEDQGAGHRRRQARYGVAAPHGSPALRRCRLRQNRSRHARRLQGHQRQQTGRRARAHHRPRLPALGNFQAALRRLPREDRNDQPLPHARSRSKKFWSALRSAKSMSSSARIACFRKT